MNQYFDSDLPIGLLSLASILPTASARETLAVPIYFSTPCSYSSALNIRVKNGTGP